MVYGKIKWLQKVVIQLIVECMFMKDVKDCNSIVKIWEIYMKGVVLKMLDDLYIDEINVLQIFWIGVLEFINEDIIFEFERIIIVIEEV